MEKQKLSISCDIVTLAVFMDCLFDDNYMALAPEATDEERVELWRKLSEEYSQKSGNVRQQHMFSLMKKIALKEAKMMVIEAAKEMPEKEGLELLRKFGYSGGKSGIEARIQRDKIMLEAHRKELQKLMDSNDGRMKSTREDFVHWLAYVGKYMGYRVDPVVVTVGEFLSMDKMMKEELKAKNKSL